MSTSMFKAIALFIVFLLSTYVASFIWATDKYYGLLTDNTCGVVRIVSNDWHINLFSLAHRIEKILIGQATTGTTMHVEVNNQELEKYFSRQLCNTSGGQEIGA